MSEMDRFRESRAAVAENRGDMEDRRTRGENLRRINRTVDPLDFWAPGPGKDAGTMTTRIPNDSKHIINVLIASRQSPFQTPGEFVRAAVMWYLAEIKPKYDKGALGDTFRNFYNYLEGAERDAIAMNLGRMQAVCKDKITKLMSHGAEREAAHEYIKMLRVAEETHPKFGRIMRTWAEAEGAFYKVRPIVEVIEAPRNPKPGTLCDDCRHTFAKHSHGGDTVECGVKGCGCQGFNGDPSL